MDDTQAQKKGTKSVGVAFQHCGPTGDVRNGQTMVMLTYASGAGHAFLDGRLYLPEEWTADRSGDVRPVSPRRVSPVSDGVSGNVKRASKIVV
ncbi:transposase [Streptomyces sp. NPDC057910]|uniref:transposase n=1 Tax=Streptomyces sp. NPDC057910 TaxID=3346278 RepID=UPI0036EF9E2C